MRLPLEDHGCLLQGVQRSDCSRLHVLWKPRGDALQLRLQHSGGHLLRRLQR